jgi:hypothetical protein
MRLREAAISGLFSPRPRQRGCGRGGGRWRGEVDSVCWLSPRYHKSKHIHKFIVGTGLALLLSCDLLVKVKMRIKPISLKLIIALLVFCHPGHSPAQNAINREQRSTQSLAAGLSDNTQTNARRGISMEELFGTPSPTNWWDESQIVDTDDSPPESPKRLSFDEFFDTASPTNSNEPPAIPVYPEVAKLIEQRHITLPSEYTPPPGSTHKVGMIDATSIVVYVEGQFIHVPHTGTIRLITPYDLIAHNTPQPQQTSIEIDHAVLHEMLTQKYRFADFQPPLNAQVVLTLRDGVSYTGQLDLVTSDKAFFDKPGFRSRHIISREEIAPKSRPLLFRADYVATLVANTADHILNVLDLIEAQEAAHCKLQSYEHAPKTIKYFTYAYSDGDDKTELTVPVFYSDKARFTTQLTFIRTSMTRGEGYTGAIVDPNSTNPEFVFTKFHRGETVLLRLPLDYFVSSRTEWRKIVEHESNLAAAEAQRRAAAEQVQAIRRESRLREEAALRERQLAEERFRQEEQHRRSMLWEAQQARQAAEAAAQKEEQDRAELIRIQRRKADAAREAVWELESIRNNQIEIYEYLTDW